MEIIRIWQSIQLPLYRFVKDMVNLNITVIAVYQSVSELRGRNYDIVNKSDIKIILNECNAEFAEQIAK